MSKTKEEYGELIEEAEVYLREEDIKKKLPSDADFIEDDKQIKVFLNPNRSSNSPGPRRSRNTDTKTTSNLSDPIEEHRVTVRKENNQMVILSK